MKPPAPFYVGQSVRLTTVATHAFIHHDRAKPLFGTVRGGSHRWDCLRVQPDGDNTVATYHMTFWEPVDGAEVSLTCAAL
jgi:hypothetical protein